MTDDTKFETLAALFVGLVILSLAMSCSVVRYRECRTVHPSWYCFENAWAGR